MGVAEAVVERTDEVVPGKCVVGDLVVEMNAPEVFADFAGVGDCAVADETAGPIVKMFEVALQQSPLPLVSQQKLSLLVPQWATAGKASSRATIS